MSFNESKDLKRIKGDCSVPIESPVQLHHYSILECSEPSRIKQVGSAFVGFEPLSILTHIFTNLQRHTQHSDTYLHKFWRDIREQRCDFEFFKLNLLFQLQNDIQLQRSLASAAPMFDSSVLSPCLIGMVGIPLQSGNFDNVAVVVLSLKIVVVLYPKIKKHALKAAIMAMLGGEVMPRILMQVTRFCINSNDKQLKKLCT